MDLKKLDKANKIGIASAISFTFGIIFSIISRDFGGIFFSFLGTAGLILGLCIALVAVYLAVNAYFAP